MPPIDLAGYAASLLAMSMWVPQAVNVVRRRHDLAALAGISLPAYATGVVFNALLAVYGVGTHGVPVVLAGAVNFVLNLAIVTVVAQARVRT
jgi:uncharacterized protein with PQ loop repeat